MFKVIFAIAISILMGWLAVTQLNLTGVNADSSPISSPISSPVTPSPSPTVSPISYPVTSQPIIWWMMPRSGNTERLVTVLGTGFGHAKGEVTFLTPSHTEYGAPIQYWSNNLVKFYVPFILLSNQTDYVAIKTSTGVQSNSMSYHIIQGEPYLQTVSPKSAKPGELITLAGEGFGTDKGQANFYDTQKHATYGEIKSWQDDKIVVKLPVTLTENTQYGMQIVSAGHTHSSITYYTTGGTPTPTPTPTPSVIPSMTPTPAPTNNDISNNSQSNDSVSAPTCNDTKPGSAPTLLSAKVTGNNEVTLQWSEAQDPVSYYLIAYGYSSDNMLFGDPNVGAKGVSSFRIQGLSGNTTYYFKVRAGDGCMPGDFSNALSVSVPGPKLITPAADFQTNVLGESTQSDDPSNVEASPKPSDNNSSLLVTPHNNVLQAPQKENFFMRVWHFITHLFGH